MKKFAVLFAAVFTICVSLNAIDFGGLVSRNSESTKVNNDSFNLAQTTDAVFNIRVPFADNGRSYFAAETMYRNESFQGKINNYIDLPLFKVNFLLDEFAENLNVSLGRYYLRDLTGDIFSQSTDGVSFIYKSDIFASSVYAGYTGLINGKITDMVGSSEYEINGCELYSLSLPYVVISSGVELPYLYMNQTLGLDFWGFIGTGILDSTKFYTTLDIRGPVSSSVFHTTSATVLFDNSNDATVAGFLGSFNLDWFLPYMNSVVSAKIKYASNNFTPVTESNFLINGSYLNNLFATGLEASFKPKSELYVLGDVLAVFKSNNFDYYGTQLSGKLILQVLSDVQLSAFATWFHSNIDVSVTNFTLKAVISF